MKKQNEAEWIIRTPCSMCVVRSALYYNTFNAKKRLSCFSLHFTPNENCTHNFCLFYSLNFFFVCCLLLSLPFDINFNPPPNNTMNTNPVPIWISLFFFHFILEHLILFTSTFNKMEKSLQFSRLLLRLPL